MPANVLLDTLELTVMQDDPNSLIFYKDLATTDSITWYIHTGLTENIINCSYESDSNSNNINNNNNNNNNNSNNNNNNDDDNSNNDNINNNNSNINNNNENYSSRNNQPLDAIHGYNLYKIKDVIYIKQNKKIPKLQKIKNKLTLQKFNNNVHFNGIPVVKYDREKDNSFLWQEIPESEDYSSFINSQNKGGGGGENINENVNVNDNENENNEENEEDDFNGEEEEENNWKPIKFNKIDLTKSANKQFGFLLKAVIKGICI